MSAQREISRGALWVATVLMGILVVASGCNLIATGLYVAKENDVKAQFTGLEGKKVAVVCRSLASLQYRNGSVAADLAKDVGSALKSKLQKKITVIEQREVAQWTDENNWEEFTEIGEALKADMVIGIDLEQFSLYQGQTLYQGKATVKVTVYDMKDGGREVFEKPMPQMLFPPSTPVASADKPEAEFRRQFVGVVAEKIARHFYGYNSRLDYASDSNFYH